MTEIVRQLCFSEIGYRRLREAIIAAGLPKKERLPPFEDYIADKNRQAAKLEKEDVMVQPTLIDVGAMLEWCGDQGLLPDAATRAKYLRLKYGDNPMRRIRKKRCWREEHGVDYDEHQQGVLACWQPINGGQPIDTRWDRRRGDKPARRPDWIEAKRPAVADDAPIESWSGRELLEWTASTR